MTITAPKKTAAIITAFIYGCGAMVIVSMATTVFLYNRLVQARHEAESALAERTQREVVNAELRNKLLVRLEGESLEELAMNRELIKEKDPSYLTAYELARRPR